MARKKIDKRIKILIQNCVGSFQRSFLIVVGSKARDQVPILHQLIVAASNNKQPNVLWCSRNYPEFNTRKIIRQLKKKVKNGTLDVNEDNIFELFVASAKIRYCKYNQTNQILGQTFGMLIMQNFEALTPNLLARTIETVEGGGIVVGLLESVTSLKQLYTLPMDVHEWYKTESHQEIVCRFNERFVLSLPSCANNLVLNDKLEVLPISSNAVNIQSATPKDIDDLKPLEQQQLTDLKESYKDTQPVGALVNLCKTFDQAEALLQFVNALSEKNMYTQHTTVALTAARGRGKSAALGLAVTASIAFNYSNIFLTSPSPENVQTVFAFILKGFDALGYDEHSDYRVFQSENLEFNGVTVKIQVLRGHMQTIQYIHPHDADKLGQAELVVIDEAAAIPLPYVKSFVGPYLVFLSSTVNGYEGTGRSLSSKLISELRQQTSNEVTTNDPSVTSAGRKLSEVTLNEPIRYQSGDSVESWLNQLLCLDAGTVRQPQSSCPEPNECQLYCINRDTLFSYHRAAEAFLQQIVGLFVASHYKNSPNDLLMMSDAPAYHLFCLLPPVDINTRILPEVLCVIQVALEGKISKGSVLQEFSRGTRAAGDLIPWTISQQFQDPEFASLSGARIVRIATHPEYQKMGYGRRALQLLQEYYEGKIPCLEDTSYHKYNEDVTEEKPSNDVEERLVPRKSLPPLLLKLSEEKPEVLDYIGVSYGLTEGLLRFWTKAGYVPVYLRQTPNDLTGEHSCIMLKALENKSASCSRLQKYFVDFRERFISLLGYKFRNFPSKLALNVLRNSNIEEASARVLRKEELDLYVTACSIKRLEVYACDKVDYHLIMDLVPVIARLCFLGRLGEVSLSRIQTLLLLSLGLQYKTVDEVSKELELLPSQVLRTFQKSVKRLTRHLTDIMEEAKKKSFVPSVDIHMEPANEPLEQKSISKMSQVGSVQGNQIKFQNKYFTWDGCRKGDVTHGASKHIKKIKSSCVDLSYQRRKEKFRLKEKKKCRNKRHMLETKGNLKKLN